MITDPNILSQEPAGLSQSLNGFLFEGVDVDYQEQRTVPDPIDIDFGQHSVSERHQRFVQLQGLKGSLEIPQHVIDESDLLVNTPSEATLVPWQVDKSNLSPPDFQDHLDHRVS